MPERETAAPRRQGVVILVGAGPGDADLITLRGASALKRADVVVHDSLAALELLDWAPRTAERVDVGKCGHGAPARDQAEINALLIERARAGNVVVRLKDGDPFVFGRGGEEARACRSAGVRFEIVPGISSALAAAAAAGIPLTDRRHAASVAIVTGERDHPWNSVDWERLSVGADTLVVLMGTRNLEQIVATLIDSGRAPKTPAAVIMEGATPRQRVVEAALDELPGAVRRAGLRPPAVIVVGDVATLRGELAWAEARPLVGRRVLVTRPASPQDALARALREAGAELSHLPLIEILPVPASASLDTALQNAMQVEAWFFTSRNAVSHTARHLRRLGAEPGRISVPIFCVGPATADAARSAGFADVVVPQDTRDAETLARAWLGQGDRRGSRVFFPRAEDARPELPRLLREAGVELRDLAVYRGTAKTLGAAELAAVDVDVVTFASPSAARVFVEAVGVAGAAGTDAARAVFAAIGPRTAETLSDLGFPAQVVAERPEPWALVDSLARFFEEREAG